MVLLVTPGSSDLITYIFGNVIARTERISVLWKLDHKRNEEILMIL